MKQQNVDIGHETWVKRAANAAVDTISYHDEDYNNKEHEHE